MLVTADRSIIPSPDSKLSEDPGQLLETLLRTSHDAMITMDLDGVVTSWNPASERMFGYRAEEIVGTSVLRLLPEYLKYQERDILERLRAGETIERIETVRRTKDDREIVVALHVSPLRSSAGQVIGALKVVRDISEKNQVDLVQLRLAAIVESADDAIVSKDLNGMITSWNRSAERIFGYTEEEVIGRSILRLIPLERHPEEAMILGKIRRGERVDHYESERLTKSGERIGVSLTISPLRDASGAVVGASKIARDITHRKLLEQKVLEAEKISASAKMAATIAHEINNPLEAVLNLIFLARQNSTEPQVMSFLDTAETELDRLAHIAKQTLGFYREQNAAARVSVAALVDHALRIYSSKLKSADIEVHAQLHSGEKVALRRGEMMQVVSNLITNAAYAMPTGGVLSISLEPARQNGTPGLLLSIKDTGVGIATENLKRIFEPFFTTRKAIGTGIGLWIAKQFVEGHNGTIQVESSTDPHAHGSTFRIWIPLITAYDAECVSPERALLV